MAIYITSMMIVTLEFSDNLGNMNACYWKA